MEISIIGSGSFLGSHLIERLGTHNIKRFGRQKDLSDIVFDLPQTPLDINDLLLSDCVIYCAGAGVQPQHKDSAESIYQVNTFAPISLINELNTRGYQGRLITFGSYFELGINAFFNPVDEIGFVENNNQMPNDYCISKRLLTQYINQKCDVLGFDVLHFIIPNLYGSGENENRIIPYIVRNLKEGNDMEFSSGEQIRQYIHILDLTTLVMKSLDSNASGIFNVSPESSISIKDLISKILKIGESKGLTIPKLRFGEVQKTDLSMKYLSILSKRSREQFGWTDEITLEQGIEAYF